MKRTGNGRVSYEACRISIARYIRQLPPLVWGMFRGACAGVVLLSGLLRRQTDEAVVQGGLSTKAQADIDPLGTVLFEILERRTASN